MKLRLLLGLFMLVLISGCASTKMSVKHDQQLVAPAFTTVRIVFIRSSFLGSAIQASVFDVTSGEPEFIGILSNATKLSHEVQPGKHVFMVVSEAADFMEATLVGGKTYFAMVTPRMGAWKARFSMYPVRNGGTGKFQYSSNEFQGWLAGTSLLDNTPESEAWNQKR